ncbi:hypothetical protein [Nocardia flavorosea]|uniref:Condensation domain-containing protein n=1 Tax=Nocardia flavorosea TaxID=53429 RepID=A0A846YDG4_9NOCA|nr:hypothetical protein [Nocardia flavorosea]NKY55782.1 hypothetical protein [Nocardia flavorosea]
MRRLSVIDGIFLRTHQGMGTPIALQGLWRTADAVDRARLDRLHDALCVGPLGRRVVRSGVPGARDRWQTSIRAHPLDMASAPLRVDDILSWADGRGAGLDPRHGPGWRLSAAPLTDGGTVVALTCSHVLTDARGLVIAVEQALAASAGNGPDLEPGPRSELAPGRGLAPGGERVLGRGPAPGGERVLGRGPAPGGEHEPGHEPAPDREPAPGRDSSAGGSVQPGGDPESDWVDAAETCATVLVGTVRAARTALQRARTAERFRLWWRHEMPAEMRLRERPAGRPGGSRSPESDSSHPVGTAVAHADLPVPALVLRCPAQEWDRVAAASGGTPNGVFIWFVANTLWAAGFPGREIVASLPVDTRDEPRIDNDLAMTEIIVAPGDDPGAIRAKSRAAYERRISSPAGLPEEILHLVPDRVAYLLSRGAGERDILCSNIGPIPEPLHALGPHGCTGVAARAIHPGLTHARRPRTRLSGYLCRFRGDYLLTLASLDPVRVPDVAGLHRLAADTAGRIGLPMVPW